MPDKEYSDWIHGNVPEEIIKSSLFRFEVSLRISDPDNPKKHKKIEVDILSDLDVDMDILEEQMQNLPSQYAFWSAVYSELRVAVAVAERNLKVRKGKATDEVTNTVKMSGTKITADQVKQIVEANPALIEADFKLANAHMTAGKVYHMLEALKMKHEVCRSLIGIKKAENN
jgi:ubiquinone biosynthesis protein COQ9